MAKVTELTADVNVDSAIVFTIPVDTREQAIGGYFPVKASVKKNFEKFYFVVNKSDLSQAVLTVRGKDFLWKMPLAGLKAGDVISHANSKGLTAVLQNTPRSFRRPLPMAHGKVHWKTTLPATLPEGTMVLRVVSQNGKVWYSRGYPLGNTPKKGEKTQKISIWWWSG